MIRVKPAIPKSSQVWRAKYDHAAAIKALADASDLDEIAAIRASIAAQKPPPAHHAEIKDAVAAAIERVKSAPPVEATDGEADAP